MHPKMNIVLTLFKIPQLCGFKGSILFSAVLFLNPLFLSKVVNAEELVNVYSYRQPELIKPLLEKFTQKTGIKTQVLFAKKGLGERIKAEGKNSPADVLLTVDIGRLDAAKKKGITQAVHSEVITKNIPESYRDSSGHWFGLSLRSRVVYASKARVEQSQITYEDLGDKKWKGKICTRSAQHVYSIGLIASMIAEHGREKTKEWLTNVKNNLAARPAGNDRAQVKNIYSGLCDLSLGNTYYMGKMQKNNKKPVQKKWADSVKILFPNNDTRGAHVNLSGVILTKYAPNKDNALRLMTFLSSNEAQAIYAEVNYEYPVNPDVPVSELVRSWGKLNPDPRSLEEIAKYRKDASILADEVLFDEGPR